MNKTAQTEVHRLFLIERLPEPLTPASSHLQIFDNYIENTRIRLRKIRDPYSNTWTHILQQRFLAGKGEPAVTKIAEMYLDDDEYACFAQFEGREIRKNRYYHEFEGISLAFDVYLGALWGLCTVKAEFETHERKDAFDRPPFAVFEVTNEAFFGGENLVVRNFAEVRVEVETGYY